MPVAIDPSDILLTDRVAVVTGGGAGIGRGVAAGMAAFGASVAIWERDTDTCITAAESVGALGIVTDVRDSGRVDAALQRITDELGPVTILGEQCRRCLRITAAGNQRERLGCAL